jgi:uncharacterized protein (DUF1778 family)
VPAITLRLSAETHAQIKAASQAQGVSMARYVREAALNRASGARQLDDLRRINLRLRRIEQRLGLEES